MNIECLILLFRIPEYILSRYLKIFIVNAHNRRKVPPSVTARYYLPIDGAMALRMLRRIRRDKDGMIRWLRLLFVAWALPVGSGAGTRAVLTVADFAPFAFACEVSDYGRSLERDFVYRAILMKPPGDPQLCGFPSRLSNADSNLTLPIEYPKDVALVVSLGGCDVYQKTEIALQLNERASVSLRYIVFYNNDPDNNDGIVPLPEPSEDSNVTVPENIERITFLSVSTSVGVNLMGLIERYAENTGKASQFLRDGNIDWDLAMLVERLNTENRNPTPSDPYASNTTRVNGGNFYWFRFILFALLMISPCVRGAYLWWNGGGRIHFRRNENGRIVGLQYVSPISYWFASSGVQDSSAAITDRLTEEQVMALPEITFKSTEEGDAKRNEENADGKVEPSQLEDVDIIVSSGSADEIEEKRQGSLSRMASVSESVRSDEEELAAGNFTTSTTCSICIEEFEHGEKLRFLPRCKHAFHTDCIMPWLTERQGCCPLCKTSVIEPEGEDDVVHELSTEEVDATPSHDNTGTQPGSLGLGATLSNEDSGGFSSGGNLESAVRLPSPEGAPCSAALTEEDESAGAEGVSQEEPETRKDDSNTNGSPHCTGTEEVHIGEDL